MRIQPSISVVAPLALGGAAASAEKTGALDNVVTLSNSLSATNNENAPTPMKRRLFQKLKKRRQLQASMSDNNKQGNAAGMPDVGILAKKPDSDPRFLQDSDSTGADDTDEIQFFCPRTTCPSALCDCAESGGSLEKCSNELQSVCLNGQLGNCVFHEYVEVYQVSRYVIVLIVFSLRSNTHNNTLRSRRYIVQ